MNTEEIEMLSDQEKIDLITKQSKRIVELELQQATNNGAKLQENQKDVKPEIPKERVERNGKQYRWTVAGFTLNGKSYKSAEASLDESVITELLKLKGQRVLIEVQ